MTTKIATGIDTQKWYSIIRTLKKKGWKGITKYNQFDKGIDFDFYEFRLNNEKILFAWDNWFEGEIKCNESRMSKLEKEFNLEFKFGNPEHLSTNLWDKLKSVLTKK